LFRTSSNTAPPPEPPKGTVPKRLPAASATRGDCGAMPPGPSKECRLAKGFARAGAAQQDATTTLEAMNPERNLMSSFL
jgi:hypothetical protein